MSLYPVRFKRVRVRQQRVDRLRQLCESLMLGEDHVEGRGCEKGPAELFVERREADDLCAGQHAAQQALKGVALSMKLQMAPRTAVLSSTTRIHGVRGDAIAEKLLAFTVEGNTNFRCFS